MGLGLSSCCKKVDIGQRINNGNSKSEKTLNKMVEQFKAKEIFPDQSEIRCQIYPVDSVRISAIIDEGQESFQLKKYQNQQQQPENYQHQQNPEYHQQKLNDINCGHGYTILRVREQSINYSRRSNNQVSNSGRFLTDEKTTMSKLKSFQENEQSNPNHLKYKVKVKENMVMIKQNQSQNKQELLLVTRSWIK